MQRTATIAIAVTLLIAAAGCSDGGGSSGSAAASSGSSSAASSPASATTSKPKADLHPGDAYVALGSSIASGFGISVQSTPCGRSNRNYPNLIAARFGLTLTDVTCGAATIPNVVDTAQGEAPPQLQSVAAGTKLVTVTVGGNDILYNGTALACSNPATECSAPADLDARVASTEPALVAMIGAIRAAAPDATVVLTTYPRELPATNCPALSLSDAELAILQDMGTRLQGVFVDVAQQTGVVFVDPYSEPGDHTGCAPPEDRWVAGAVADDGFAFHPTALGHQVMAQMIATALSP